MENMAMDTPKHIQERAAALLPSIGRQAETIQYLQVFGIYETNDGEQHRCTDADADTWVVCLEDREIDLELVIAALPLSQRHLIANGVPVKGIPMVIAEFVEKADALKWGRDRAAEIGVQFKDNTTS